MVRSLCQGTPDEQRRTIDRYFTPDAEFVHPFCAAPRFSEGDLRLPGLRRLGSRDALRGIFQWYRMLSPKIVIDIDTACKLFNLTIRCVQAHVFLIRTLRGFAHHST